MALTQDEQDQLREILVVLYGSQFSWRNPSETTLDLVEEVLLEIRKCNKRIYELFASLPCAIVGRGFLKRCLRAASRIVRNNSIEFRGCQNLVILRQKTPIWLSTTAR